MQFRNYANTSQSSPYVRGLPSDSVSVRLLAHGDHAWPNLLASRAKLCDRVMAGWRLDNPPAPNAGADAYARYLADFQDWQRVLGDPDAYIGRPNVEVTITENGDPYFYGAFRFAAIGLHHRECAEFACDFLWAQMQKNPQRPGWGIAGSDGAYQFWLAMILQASRMLRAGKVE